MHLDSFVHLTHNIPHFGNLLSIYVKCVLNLTYILRNHICVIYIV